MSAIQPDARAFSLQFAAPVVDLGAVYQQIEAIQVMANQSDQGNKKPAQQSENARIRERRRQQREQAAAEAGTGTAKTYSASSRTMERRQERKQEQQRQRLVRTGLIIGAIVLVAAFVFLVTQIPADAPLPEGMDARYASIEQTETEDGFPRLGDPAAPVQVVEYSSFDCVACKNFHDAAIDGIIERVRGGQVSFTYVPLYGTGSVTNGQGAARAAMCAAEQGQFWAFHDTLFHWQNLFGNQAFPQNRILTGVANLGLDRGAFDGCVRGGAPDTILNEARTQAVSVVNPLVTPAITIQGVLQVDENGQSQADPAAILAAIDRAIAEFGGEPAAESTAEAPAAESTAEAAAEATSEATEEATAEATPAAAEVEATPEAAESTPEATTEAGG
jgi:protein-disulfide isomerase